MATRSIPTTRAEAAEEARKAQRALDLAIRRADDAARILEQLAIAAQPPESSVLRFVRTLPISYGNMTKDYRYAAIRAGDLWYLTGVETRGKTWSQLIEFVRKGGNAMQVELLEHGSSLDLS